MSAEIVSLSLPPVSDSLTCHERLARMSALIAAIDAGELLSALPECPVARADHVAALSLLSMLELDIHALRAELPDDL
jgi:hypothetical protein